MNLFRDDQLGYPLIVPVREIGIVSPRPALEDSIAACRNPVSEPRPTPQSNTRFDVPQASHTTAPNTSTAAHSRNGAA